MDPIAFWAKLLLAIILIIVGVGYAFLRIAADRAGDPDQGWLWGWGPVLTGIGIAVIGVLLVIY